MDQVREGKERRSNQIFTSTVAANKVILGEQAGYVQRKHAEKLSPSKSRYNPLDGSPLQRFSPSQLKHMMDIRDQKLVASATKKELAAALQAQMAEDKHRHDYREIDLVPKEMATSGDIMQ